MILYSLHGLFCYSIRLFCTVTQNGFQFVRFTDLIEILFDGSNSFLRDSNQIFFEISITAASVFRYDIIDGFTGECTVNAQQIADTRLVFRIEDESRRQSP